MSLRRTLQLLLAVAVATVALALGTGAGATGNPDYTVPPPSSAVHRPAPKAPKAVKAKPTRHRLAITGSDVGELVLMGGVLVAGGAGTMMLRRRATV